MKIEERHLVSGRGSFPCQFHRPRPPVLPRPNRENREKAPKCTKNDHFRQICFLNTAYFHSNYTPIDAELHVEFFEPTFMCVTCNDLELLKKNRSKNRRRNSAHPNGF